MEENIFALKPSFIEKLYQLWKDEFSSSQNHKFLDHINEVYDSNELKKHLLPGDNGIYIDDDVIYRINTLNRVGTKTNWDYEASKLLFNGCGNGLGIYQKDEDGNKVPLDMVYATDTRIWNYLSLFRLSKYTKNRWGDSKDSKRLFINTLSNEKVTRHPIMRLYWTSKLCYDINRGDKLELLKILWQTNDFMTQVTERAQSNMRQQTLWFLDFCNVPENNQKLFNEKSIEGDLKYRKLLKLYLATDRIYMIADTDKEQFDSILNNLLIAC